MLIESILVIYFAVCMQHRQMRKTILGICFVCLYLMQANKAGYLAHPKSKGESCWKKSQNPPCKLADTMLNYKNTKRMGFAWKD